MSLKSRMRKRDWHPLRKRNRYRRCSTTWNGQVLPFAMSMLPKNSGFQYGAKSPSGISGVTMPSKKARESG
jgi:hypothetical protein